jgi:NAD(P)-dependent dehydrogenase (short-subunit alcohol dehydrogenase family)
MSRKFFALFAKNRSAAAVAPVSCLVLYFTSRYRSVATLTNVSGSNKMTTKALVVGGTSGIGKGIALALAQRGNVAVTIAGRSKERGDEIVKELEKICPSQKHSFQQVDAFDLKSVKKLADVDTNLLVMTQGMGTLQGYTPTVDGIDQKLQLHYFSRIYLANLMAKKLSTKESPKVLTVLSAGVHSKYTGYKDDFDLSKTYSQMNAANAAGLYMDAAFESLAKRYPSIVFAHAAPGFVNTNWGTEMPVMMKGLIRMMQPLGRSLEKCGELLTTGWMELEPTDDNNYFLLDRNGKVVMNGMKHNEEDREVIWTKTMELLPED